MMKKIKAGIIILLSLLTFTSGFSFVQEEIKISPYISLQYFKDTDNNTFLKTTLTYSKNRMELPLPGAKVLFYSGKRNLGEITTDTKGIAFYSLKDKSDFSPDEKGLWPFSIVFEGNDSIGNGTAELLIRNASLTMELTEIDSIKTILLKAEKSENGKMIPVTGEALTVYVPRMFSFLPIGEATFDEEGNASLEFPADLPGDKEGKITLIARFEEHPEYGNIESKLTQNWGVPAASPSQVVHRALWTKTAPRWMIYSLSILLAGVWGHYLFAIISLVRIRKDAKRKEKEEDNYGKL
jgi:hypothetical protein